MKRPSDKPVELLIPASLADLFCAFEKLDRGISVTLSTAEQSQLETAKATKAPSPGVCLGVWSSGSTGQPKFLWKSWPTLKASAAMHERLRGWTWCSAFDAVSFAGVHVALQAWISQGQVLSLNNHWSESWRLLTTRQPEAICCTPTFLDLLLQVEELSAQTWNPRQITLGGEVLRPIVASRIRVRFPDTRITVVYASAEFGVLAKTHRMDGWYELNSLSQHSGRWQVREGILELFQDEAWRQTGDHVELDGEYFRVLGRADGVANVAGVKISLPEIAAAAEEVTGIRQAVASFEPNAVVGQIVSLKFAVDPGLDVGEVQLRLQEHLRCRLRKEAWPRRWILDDVGLGRNSKGIVR